MYSMCMNKPELLCSDVNVKITNLVVRAADRSAYVVAQTGFAIELVCFLFLLLLSVCMSVHLDTVGRIKQNVNSRFL